MAVNRYDMSYTANSAPYTFWGTVYNPGDSLGANKSFDQLRKTRNATGVTGPSYWFGLSASVPSFIPVNLLAWTYGERGTNKSVAITANVAWKCEINYSSGDDCFSLNAATGNVSLLESGGSGTWGGNGTIWVNCHSYITQPSTSFLRIYYATEGSQGTYTINLTQDGP